MKKIIKRVIIILLSVMLCLLLLVIVLRFKRILDVQNYITKLTVNAQEGDILCRLGDRSWSLYFKSLSYQDKRFSHLGILHFTADGITVINAEGTFWNGKNCVEQVPLRDFIEPARILGLYRLIGVDGTEISTEALKMTGLPFDWHFDLETVDEVYCTELLYASLKIIDPKINLKTIHMIGKEIIPLEAVSNSPQFTEILFLK
ncbi:MAG: hypothetical protein LBG57_14055 [Treponema sp.]|nr:hypothetical protein [Treponema sp.]